MTNLTTEQFREVLEYVREGTEKIPTVQQLLRRAVANFYARFGAYPEFAGISPGKIGVLGDQTEFSGGIALLLATPMATIMVGRKSANKSYAVVSSSDVGKPHKITFSSSEKRPLKQGCPVWLNHVKSVMAHYAASSIPGFEALLETSIPFGVGFGSGVAVEVATYTFLEMLTGDKTESCLEKALDCQSAELEFLDRHYGLTDPMTCIMSKDRHGTLIDCKSQGVECIPFTHPDVTFIAVDSHLKDTLLGEEYFERSELIAKACEILEVSSLRDCTEEDLVTLEEKIRELLEEGEGESSYEGEVYTAERFGEVVKRARFFLAETRRVEEALTAWRESDFQLFGDKMTESHAALRDDFDFSNPLLNFLAEKSLKCEGVFGSRMTGKGLGLGGGVITLIKKENVEDYCRFLTDEFLSYEEQAKIDCLENWKKLTEKTCIGGNGDEEEELSPDFEIKPPSFYILTPFPGARMMFVTKTDLLRSLFAIPVPDPKSLVREALDVYNNSYNTKVESVGLAPATVAIFGEVLEHHNGSVIYLALPMVTAVVGGRSDNVLFSFETTSADVEEPAKSQFPVPCVRSLSVQPQQWMNHTNGCISLFDAPVPGFNAVIHSSIPLGAGINSCSALQVSVYKFLEHLTRTRTDDPYVIADRCQRSEDKFVPLAEGHNQTCSVLKYLPTLLCREGSAMFVNCKTNAVAHHFFDDPRYVFLIACCKRNTTDLTAEGLEERVRLCREAAEIIGKDSLSNAEEKHIRCLRKRDASQEMIKRATYVIMENQRTLYARKAMNIKDYARFGLLMSQSHNSLRDEYEISSPEIESLVNLALCVDGVLGAKLVGSGLKATVAILVTLAHADSCIRFMRKKYKPKDDKPVFYITKPSRGAFNIDLEDELENVP